MDIPCDKFSDSIRPFNLYIGSIVLKFDIGHRVLIINIMSNTMCVGR